MHVEGVWIIQIVVVVNKCDNGCVVCVLQRYTLYIYRSLQKMGDIVYSISVTAQCRWVSLWDRYLTQEQRFPLRRVNHLVSEATSEEMRLHIYVIQWSDEVLCITNDITCNDMMNCGLHTTRYKVFWFSWRQFHVVRGQECVNFGARVRRFGLSGGMSASICVWGHECVNFSGCPRMTF